MNWTVEVTADARDELANWPYELRASLTKIVARIEAIGLERVGEPFAKHLGDKLWELRPSGRKIEGRALYITVSGRRVVIVLAFQKRTRKTPRRMIDLALKRARRISI